jgi:colanic acid/amylovoran biosynthesis glycosyltransferase
MIDIQQKPLQSKVVVHDVGVWLPRTKTWLYSEVTETGPDWEAWVIANRTQNLSEFPYDNLFSLRDRYGYLRWFFEHISYRLGINMQCPSIRNFVIKIRPDILHSHFGPCGWRNINLAKSISAKHIVSFYGTDVTKVPLKNQWRKRYYELFEKVDAILCEGPHMSYTIQQLGCPKEKIHLYHLGVNLEAIKFKKSTWSKGKTLRILMAATFTEKKGFPYGLKAIASFTKKNKGIDTKVTVIGNSNRAKGPQGEKEKIMKIIQEDKLGIIVTMKDFCSHSELLKMASEHDIFLSPSIMATDGDTEGGAPVSIIEMAAAGLIIVSTKHCDIPHVLGKKNSQLLVDERNSVALAKILEWLVENTNQWQAIADENRELIEQEFNIKNQGPALAKIYNKLISL